LKSPKGNYFLLPNKIFDEDLTSKEFHVYSYLVRCKNKQHQCWPSRETIAKACKIKSLVTVDKVLNELEDKGFIEKRNRYDFTGKGKLSNIYTINKL
jgi:predicted transcriptional regulator